MTLTYLRFGIWKVMAFLLWKSANYWYLCATLLQSCPALRNCMGRSLPGSSVHGIFQARLLEWVVMPSSRGCSLLRDQTRFAYVSCIGRWILYQGGIKGATREAQKHWSGYLPGYLPGHLPDPEIEPGSSALQVDSLLAELPGKPATILPFFISNMLCIHSVCH